MIPQRSSPHSEYAFGAFAPSQQTEIQIDVFPPNPRITLTQIRLVSNPLALCYHHETFSQHQTLTQLFAVSLMLQLMSRRASMLPSPFRPRLYSFLMFQYKSETSHSFAVSSARGSDELSLMLYRLYTLRTHSFSLMFRYKLKPSQSFAVPSGKGSDELS